MLRPVSALCSTSERQTLFGFLLGPLGCPWILLGILTIREEFSIPLPSLLVKSPPGSLGPLLGSETEGNRGDGKALVPWMISVATYLDLEGLSLEENQTCAWGLEREALAIPLGADVTLLLLAPPRTSLTCLCEPCNCDVS